MAVPDELLIAGAVVGLAGGLIGIATGVDNLITRVRRGRQSTRDAEMILEVEFGDVEGFAGVDTRKYPYATARISNNGKIAAKDLRVESSTGYALCDTTMLFPDVSTIVTFPLVAVQELGIERLFKGDEKDKWAPVETPYGIDRVELSLSWRIDGTSARSEPKPFEHPYSESPFH